MLYVQLNETTYQQSDADKDLVKGAALYTAQQISEDVRFEQTTRLPSLFRENTNQVSTTKLSSKKNKVVMSSKYYYYLKKS